MNNWSPFPTSVSRIFVTIVVAWTISPAHVNFSLKRILSIPVRILLLGHGSEPLPPLFLVAGLLIQAGEAPPPNNDVYNSTLTLTMIPYLPGFIGQEANQSLVTCSISESPRNRPHQPI
ncbi:hypothetical protein Salat_1793500 [Sesamum alatum]|uniref:Uncharacterized protein n=1 Tax=Sesamum alatum TaxID=300844 RepID=A0AAE1Y904_9LAMI|nr:hypothetical protein Salat_1793500 [Sesamum alatum]